jgi:hypothetical protein
MKSGKFAILTMLVVPMAVALTGCASGWQDIRAKAKRNDVYVRGMELGSAKYEAQKVPGGVRLTAWGQASGPVRAVCLTESPEQSFDLQYIFYWDKADCCDAKQSNKFITEGWFVVDDNKKTYVIVYDKDGRHFVPIVAAAGGTEVASN